MDDNIRQRLETVKSILRSIGLSYPDQIDFMFVAIDTVNKGGNLDYLFSVKNENSPQGFHTISEISNQDFFTQKRYRFEAETNKSQIVYCVDPEYIHPDAIPLMKGKLYKIIETYNLYGQVYYKLEFLENNKESDFRGYESERLS